MALTPLIYAVIALIVVFLIAVVAKTYFRVPTNISVVINVVLGLIVVGVVLWLINTYVPMAGAIRGLLNIVVFLAACVGVLQALGLWNPTIQWFQDFRSHRL